VACQEEGVPAVEPHLELRDAGFFKYFDFFVDNVIAAFHGLGIELARPALQIVLPVGISFYTFQTLSYTIDVYLGNLKARRSLLDVRCS